MIDRVLYKREKGHSLDIRLDRIQLCRGDRCAASLMDVFDRWTSWKVAELDKDRKPNESPWVFLSMRSMRRDLLGLFGEPSIKRGLAVLNSLGVLSQERPEKIGEAIWYLFDYEEANRLLKSIEKEVDPEKPSFPNRRRGWEEKVKSSFSNNAEGPSAIMRKDFSNNAEGPSAIMRTNSSSLNSLTLTQTRKLGSPFPPPPSALRPNPAETSNETHPISEPVYQTLSGDDTFPTGKPDPVRVPFKTGGRGRKVKNPDRWKMKPPPGMALAEALDRPESIARGGVVVDSHPESSARPRASYDFPARWNALVPEKPVTVEFYNGNRRAPDSFSVPAFRDRFEEICEKARKLNQGGADLAFSSLFRVDQKSGLYWWQELLDGGLNWMAKKNGNAKLESKGASDDDIDKLIERRRKAREEREAQPGRTD